MNCCRSVVFSGFSVSSTNKTDRHDIAEILLKVALNTITLTCNPESYNAEIIFVTDKYSNMHLL
jgi:hypothetical protein